MSITWNGVSSDTIGVIVERIPNRYVPTRRFSPQQVAGRNGNILLVDKSFPNVEQEYEVYLSAEAQGLPSVARACAEWLMGPTGYCRLQDSYDTTVYREAFLMGGYDLENILNKFGRCTITFSCKPQKYLMTDETLVANNPEIYSGAIANFTATADDEITSLTAAIAPVQSFNGYDRPWAAGAGNNKAYWPTLTNSSSSDVDYTILDDGNTLHVEGTASAGSTPWAASLSSTYANMPLGPYPAGEYTIIANGLVGQNTNDRIAFTARYADSSSVSGGSGRISGPTSTIPNGTGVAVTFTATDEFKIGFYMVISSGTSVNCDVKIQLEKASSVGSWEPYANICPITGWTGANISRTGKNLFDEANATVYKRYMNASDKWMGDANSGSYAFPCKPYTNYVVTANNENLALFRVGYANVETLANGIQLYNVTRLTSAGTIQIHTGADATYIIVQCTAAIINAKNTQLQIEYGSTASAYEAYIGNTYSVDWTSAAGTVYAGTYDAVSGKLKARPQYASYNGETLVGPWLSSMDVYAEGTTPTTGAQVVDLGGTETEYTLTGQTVSPIVGQNYVWADTGDVSVAVYGHITASTTNPTPFDARPIITVSGAGTLTINGYDIEILESVSDFTINCETMEAEDNKKISCLEFPVLSGGSNTVTCDAGITSLTMIPRWWTL